MSLPRVSPDRCLSALDQSVGAPLVVLVKPLDDGPAEGHGPLDRAPQVGSGIEASELLTFALRGIPLGRADKALLARTERWQWSDVAIIASLLERARQAGRVSDLR